MDAKSIENRIDALWVLCQGRSPKLVGEVFHGTMTVMQAMYGLNSNQEKSLREYVHDVQSKYSPSSVRIPDLVISNIWGILDAMKAEISSGFVGSVQSSVTGDVLTDLIKLSKVAIEEAGDDAKDVAAVLSAAAFEDTIRRIAIKHKIPPMEKLADIITELKNRQVLQGPQVGIAQSYLGFRNKALHAGWSQIERPSVYSVLAFTEQLILAHFF
jgi:hypothetical protein